MAASFLSAIKAGLARTRNALVGQIESVFARGSGLDSDVLDELEAALIEADLGVAATHSIMEALRDRAAKGERISEDVVRNLLEAEILDILGPTPVGLLKADEPPTVIMVVGVNGTGKTTSIGKLAAFLSGQGTRVILGAADTFRAAAIDQLEVWGNRAGCQVIRQKEGSDPAAVAFDAYHAAVARRAEYLIVDTAGRLHTKTNLMEELRKVKRVLARERDSAPHEILLVLDATTGQNAVAQAKAFNDAVGVTGIVLTKLDGTARGGIVVAVAQSLGIPVKFVGVGEGLDDLKPFHPEDFVRGLLRS
ncbi:MAG: signal recognition particle-docking protein FtsY [Firmicutes bacterium]|nr:signal recognition particle-docking protein FtsY [Bacillota bacterium]